MSDISSLSRSDLNTFLFADIGLEANGTMLNVISLIARRDTDPWQEAGRLAALPKDTAADSLAHDIAEMPQGRWNAADAIVIARRLIGLLPVRPAKVEMRIPLQQGSLQFSARNAVVMACLAIGMAFALAGMMHPPSAAAINGKATSVPAPRSEGASGIGAPALPSSQFNTKAVASARPPHE